MSSATANTVVRQVPAVVEDSADSLDARLARAAKLAVSSDPFRLSNRPALVRYDPASETGSPSSPRLPAPSPQRPVMTLKAIVGGPPWQAIIDGIPGRPPGTVVRAGESFDKLHARLVTRDSVVIQGQDTTWVLGFRKTP
jgi:hypothetical protein